VGRHVQAVVDAGGVDSAWWPPLVRAYHGHFGASNAGTLQLHPRSNVCRKYDRTVFTRLRKLANSSGFPNEMRTPGLEPGWVAPPAPKADSLGIVGRWSRARKRAGGVRSGQERCNSLCDIHRRSPMPFDRWRDTADQLSGACERTRAVKRRYTPKKRRATGETMCGYAAADGD